MEAIINGRYLTLGPISRDGRAGISALCSTVRVGRGQSSSNNSKQRWSTGAMSSFQPGKQLLLRPGTAGHGSLLCWPSAHFPLT